MIRHEMPTMNGIKIEYETGEDTVYITQDDQEHVLGISAHRLQVEWMIKKLQEFIADGNKDGGE
jgi:hypothetical protein